MEIVEVKIVNKTKTKIIIKIKKVVWDKKAWNKIKEITEKKTILNLNKKLMNILLKLKNMGIIQKFGYKFSKLLMWKVKMRLEKILKELIF